MNDSKRRQLLKLLNRTSDENDGEALAAIRLVNQRLKADGFTWETLLLGTAATPLGEDPEVVEIRQAFEYLARCAMKGEFADLIQKLRVKFNQTQSLTPRERHVVIKAKLDPRNNPVH